MNSKKMILPSLLSGCAMGILFSGCIGQKGGQAPQVDIWSTDTTIYLKEGLEKPSCKIYMELAYLKPTSETDSISGKINSNIQQEIFGNQYTQLSPTECGEALQHNYITDYHTNVKKLFDADMHNGMKDSDIPAWYNYEYEITSSLEAGHDSVWNYTITQFSYTGGAHPNTQKRMINIDAVSGNILNHTQTFRMEEENNICSLILKQLITEANKRLETDTITSIEELNEVGFLLNSKLEIPENFLLGKDGVTFYYNRYEIAPYSSGDFTLTVPYEEIQVYLKK